MSERLVYSAWHGAIEAFQLEGPDEPSALGPNSLVAIRSADGQAVLTGEELSALAWWWVTLMDRHTTCDARAKINREADGERRSAPPIFNVELPEEQHGE